MNHKFSLALGLALTISSVSAQRFTITQNLGGDTFGARSTGQTFTPSIGILPNPGTVTTLPLEKVTVYHGNFVSAKPSATTYLNIYEGDPNAGGTFVGSSENAVDTRGLTFHDPIVWQFMKLDVKFSTKHFAVMSSTNTAGGLDVEVSLETEPRAGDSYAGGAGLIANIKEHPNGVDAKCELDFFTAIQGSLTITGTGCAGSGGTPTIGGALRPQVGRPFQLDFTNLVSGSRLFLIIGASNSSWNSFSLPVPVASIIPGTNPSCTLYASLDLLTPFTVSGTSFSLPAAVPNDPTLFGVALYTQGVQGEASGQLSVTALGEIFIGQ